ncbi:hypothetical protein B0H14DRAFT_2594582 [Mycena olivaceomarginata]|nr:hypothetical protein B0H14DRAFT_2594582 [Mycena olivaceomarginata]
MAKGTNEDEIHCVLTTIHSPKDGSRAASSTFNRRFNILFKEDAQCHMNKYGTLSRAWAGPKTRGFAIGSNPSAGIASALSTTRIPAKMSRNVFQALALDEKRAAFSPTLWSLPSSMAKTHLQQCWFPGAAHFLAFNNKRLEKELEPYEALPYYTFEFYLNGQEIRRPGQYPKMQNGQEVNPFNESVHLELIDSDKPEKGYKWVKKMDGGENNRADGGPAGRRQAENARRRYVKLGFPGLHVAEAGVRWNLSSS